MNGPVRRFTPSEVLDGSDQGLTEAELADALAAARSLEAHAAADLIGPTEGFEDRVMSTIAKEPPPRVVLRLGPAVRGGWPVAILNAVRDSWAIATGGGRPLAVRAQALGFLLLAIVVVGSLGTVSVVGVGTMLEPHPSPVPSIAPVSTTSPSPESSSGPSPSPSPAAEPSEPPTATREPTDTAEPTEPSGATERPEGTDDHGGTSSTDAPDPTATVEPEDTPKPGETLKPGETVKPGETPAATDDRGSGSASD